MFKRISQVYKEEQVISPPTAESKRESLDIKISKIVLPVPIRTLIQQSQQDSKGYTGDARLDGNRSAFLLAFNNKENFKALQLKTPEEQQEPIGEEIVDEEEQDLKILDSCPQEKKILYTTLKDSGKKIQHLKRLYKVLLKLFLNIPIRIEELELSEPETLILNEILKRKNKDLILQK